MDRDRIWTAAELELLSPDERSRIVDEGMVDSLDSLPAAFRARVEATARRITVERGLLDADTS